MSDLVLWLIPFHQQRIWNNKNRAESHCYVSSNNIE